MQVLDWYHAREHLAQLAHDCFPDDSQLAHQWYHRMSNRLFQGQVTDIMIDAQAHQQSTTYFENQQRRMQYQAFQTQGLPLGPGGVESGSKQYKHRLTATGMRWSRQGAQRLIVIRSAVFSDPLTDLWEQAA